MLLAVISKILQERDELRKELAGLEGEIEENEGSPKIKDLRGLEKLDSAGPQNSKR